MRDLHRAGLCGRLPTFIEGFLQNWKHCRVEESFHYTDAVIETTYVQNDAPDVSYKVEKVTPS